MGSPAPTAQKVRLSVKTLGRAWLLIGATVVVFGLGEGLLAMGLSLRDAFRPANPEPPWRTSDVFAGTEWIGAYADEFQRAMVMEWHAYVQWRLTRFEGQLITVGPGGIRRTWNTEECAAGAAVTRIFLFGGSTLWGTGARDEFTIPSFVARKLAQRGYRRVCVTNWGESGYVSTQEALTLLLQLREGNVPHIVVFYDGVNDTAAAHQNGVAGVPMNEVNRRAEFNLTKRPGEMIARGTLVAVRKSSTYRLWSKLATALRDGEDAFRREDGANEGDAVLRLPADIVKTYVANVEAVRGLSRAYGMKALFYWQPVAFVSKPVTASEARQVESERYLERLFRATYARVARDQALRDNGDFRDLSAIFRDVTESVFIDFAHTSEAGNARIAEEIVRDLTRLLAGHAASAPDRQ